MTTDGANADDRMRTDLAFRCEQCGHRWYYTRGRCPDCGEEEVTTDELGVGELLASTRVDVTPEDVRSPNRLGLVAFDDVQVIAQLDGEGVSVGDRVTFSGEHTLREGDEQTHPRLTPVATAE
ncbi:Zn-ribbon domain-containing OB-fold protein [Halobellus clavatus]|jgi:uncharacterized OB-fold protein|uniref:DUF35 domain-containing protein n=1 Tax=Halobellus clavatus TaxID=660517 RepID=A0A1H3E776_9EURY|nr:hypothetical protein [Halobellus clavatus]SDX74593.1 hypothetical protein SAMN04487946_10293 [Halobellus clavatus]